MAADNPEVAVQRVAIVMAAHPNTHHTTHHTEWRMERVNTDDRMKFVRELGRNPSPGVPLREISRGLFCPPFRTGVSPEFLFLRSRPRRLKWRRLGCRRRHRRRDAVAAASAATDDEDDDSDSDKGGETGA